jgi:hypothetical protein
VPTRRAAKLGPKPTPPHRRYRVTDEMPSSSAWVATRGSLSAPWSAPVNLGSVVNTTAAETRPSLSRDGKQLLFGRSPGPEGGSDIYVTTRP